MLISLFLIYLHFADILNTNDSADDPTNLNLRVEELVEKNEYLEALPLAIESLDAFEKAYGTNHPFLAVPLNNLAYIYYMLDQYTNAEPLYLQALKIREASLGSNNLYTANVLINMGDMYDAMNQLNQADECFCRAAEIVKNKFEKQSAEVGYIIAKQGWVKEEMGDYKAANSAYFKSLIIQSTIVGSNKVNSLPVLRDYARSCMFLADYTNSEQIYIRILSTQEHEYGTNSLEIKKALNDLGVLYEKTGKLEKSEECYRRLLDIYESNNKTNTGYLATCYDNIGELKVRTGDFPAAEEYLLKSIKIDECVYGANCLESVEALNNLGCLYREINNFKKAEDILNLAIRIHTSAVTNYNTTTSTLFLNLASVYVKNGDFKKADALFRKSLEICKYRIGSNHPDTAVVLRDWAEMYKLVGLYDEAKVMFESVLTIDRNQLGEYHPDTLSTLFDLAILYNNAGDYKTGNTLLKKALNDTQITYGTNSYQIWPIENGLVLSEIMLNNPEKAAEYAKQERVHSEINLANTLSFTSAAERALNQQYSRSPLNSLAQLGCANELSEGILRLKGVVLDSSIEDQQTALGLNETKIDLQLEKLKLQKHTLNNVMLKVPADYDSSTVRNLDHERFVQSQAFDDLEKSIVKQVSKVKQSRRSLSVKSSDVQFVLPRSCVVLEFLSYNIYLGKTDWESRYGAVLITNAKEPVWVPLGSATNIDLNLQQYETMMRSHDRGDATVLKTLYTQIMAPILKKLPANVTNLIISPDSDLNFLSFATLLNNQNEFLGEHFNISYVSSGRDIVFGKQVEQGNGQIAVFANPDFHTSPTQTSTNSALALLESDRRDYNGISLGTLPNTAKEADYLHGHSLAWHLTDSVFVGPEATEAQVKCLHSPYILHLATHGFFLPDTDTNLNNGLGLNKRPAVALHNPMMRSGLALAGAQTTLDAWNMGQVPDTENDGILMAEEVGLLDLKNTWLVTLSACDTGIGEARAGEGVMGLRRGFILSGTQNLLMTLWPVSDKWTADLMQQFYDEALKSKNAPGALANVQRNFLKKLRIERSPVIAARLAGPFVMNFQGKPINN